LKKCLTDLKPMQPPIQAYTSGKLKIEGHIMKSQLLEKLNKIG
jgi:hypothetical protein